LQSCRITYDLPGPDGDSGVLVDLIDDEDLEMMWEEFDSYAVSDMLLTVLHLCHCPDGDSGVLVDLVHDDVGGHDDVGAVGLICGE
jgi:hypothetical protein